MLCINNIVIIKNILFDLVTMECRYSFIRLSDNRTFKIIYDCFNYCSNIILF